MTTEQGKQLWREAFGDPDSFIEAFFRSGFSPLRCRALEEKGQLAAALYWFDCRWGDKKLAYIYGVATAKAFRGKGLCRKLMADAHRHLHGSGYAGAVLVPADDGLFQMYEKMGYRGFSPMEKREMKAAGRTEISQIDAARYADLRRQRLPEGGILQEGDTLSFLESYARFYTAGDAAFCAAREGDTLYIQEFFGDPEKIPAIAATLSAAKVTVRLPGGKKDFAMYKSFTEDDAMPGYFGIALD